MFQDVISTLTNFIVNTISTLGYPGVGFLMALQTVAIPIPSEIILPFAGYLASIGRFNIWITALVGALASCVGASVAYYIGARGGRPLVEKYGRMILISKHDLEIADNFFKKYGSKAVFIGMMLPVFRSFIAFPAGVSKVPMKKFLANVFFGSFIWGLLLVFLGMKLGENWHTLRDRLHGFDMAIVGLIVLLGVYWVWRHIKNLKAT